jgi:hypothetical protein
MLRFFQAFSATSSSRFLSLNAPAFEASPVFSARCDGNSEAPDFKSFDLGLLKRRTDSRNSAEAAKAVPSFLSFAGSVSAFSLHFLFWQEMKDAGKSYSLQQLFPPKRSVATWTENCCLYFSRKQTEIPRDFCSRGTSTLYMCTSPLNLNCDAPLPCERPLKSFNSFSSWALYQSQISEIIASQWRDFEISVCIYFLDFPFVWRGSVAAGTYIASMISIIDSHYMADTKLWLLERARGSPW